MRDDASAIPALLNEMSPPTSYDVNVDALSGQPANLAPMVLTDREAVDIKANQAVGQAHQTMTRALQANRGNIAMAFRNGLREAVAELSARLIDLYAQLDDAESHQDELVAEVTRRVTSFIKSQQAGQRGSHVAATAREAANAIGNVEMGTKTSFRLAVYEHTKKRNDSGAVAASTNQKGVTDKISIFWAWQSDFKTSRNQIEEVLAKVIEKANAEWGPMVPIVLEQAVSLGDGAVRIDGALLDKIRSATFFVGDMTPVAVVEDNLLPNANVLIEVGYALASKDPKHIFLVENTARTAELKQARPDARFPFDIEHVHRFGYQEPRKLRDHVAADLRVRLAARNLLRVNKDD